jgi:hypothetical protein
LIGKRPKSGHPDWGAIPNETNLDKDSLYHYYEHVGYSVNAGTVLLNDQIQIRRKK